MRLIRLRKVVVFYALVCCATGCQDPILDRVESDGVESSQPVAGRDIPPEGVGKPEEPKPDTLRPAAAGADPADPDTAAPTCTASLRDSQTKSRHRQRRSMNCSSSWSLSSGSTRRRTIFSSSAGS